MITKIKWKDDNVLGNLKLNPKSGKPIRLFIRVGGKI